MASDPRQPLATQFRAHFGHREHLYAVLLAEIADDLEAGGPSARILRDHLDAPRGDAVHLRLLAGLFRIVLRGEAPALAAFYPCLGGSGDPEQAWRCVRPELERHAEELRSALDLAPQTNEVGRSANLAIGLFEAVRRHGLRRIRLLEPGASAGLNLLVDRFRFVGPDWAWGPEASPLVLDTLAGGVRPEELEIVERRGCDLAPIRADTRDGAERLTSFVWPFDLTRHARLAAALEIAAAHPVDLDRASASTWLRDQLARPVTAGVLTVVWSSITQQYWPAEETTAVQAALADARARMPIAHVSLEGVPPTQIPGGYDWRRDGPHTCVDGEQIARSTHHGPPLALV